MRILRISRIVLVGWLFALPAALAQEKPDRPEDAAEFLDAITLPEAPKPVKARSQSVPPPVSPATSVAPLAAPRVVTSLPRPVEKVDVGMLGTAEGATVGLLEGAHGLGDDLWSGSERARVVQLLAAGTLVSSDPPMRELSRRIFLTKAQAPGGPSKHTTITLRIKELLKAGLIEEAGALAAQATLTNDPEFSRMQADALLYAGRSEDVCSNRTAARLSSGEPYWVELRAYCAAVSGDTALVDLTLAVLNAGGGDKAFEVLFDDVLKGEKKSPPAVDRPTALHVYLLRKAGLPVPGWVAAPGGTPENLYVMRDSRNPLPVRIAAAERIVATGAASASELKALADSENFPLSEFADAAVKASTLPFFAGQALLRSAAKVARQDQKAQLVHEALELGEKYGLLPLAAALQSDNLMTLVPSRVSYAPQFVRALVLSGNPVAATRWQVTGPLQTSVMLLTGDGRSYQAMATYTNELSGKGFVADGDAKALVLEIADALGRLSPDLALKAAGVLGQPWSGRRPDATAMREINEAAMTHGRKGEALLLIMEKIRNIGWKHMAPDTSAQLIRLVAALGQKNMAEGFACEALMLYEPPPPLQMKPTP
jgi:hypothetical protein